MTYTECGHYAFTVIRDNKIQCHECGTINEDTDTYQCDECGEEYEDGEGLDHYEKNHPEIVASFSKQNAQPEDKA